MKSIPYKQGGVLFYLGIPDDLDHVYEKLLPFANQEWDLWHLNTETPPGHAVMIACQMAWKPGVFIVFPNGVRLDNQTLQKCNPLPESALSEFLHSTFNETGKLHLFPLL